MVVGVYVKLQMAERFIPTTELFFAIARGFGMIFVTILQHCKLSYELHFLSTKDVNLRPNKVFLW